MALSIKSTEADRLARDLAATTGETLTDAVTNALRERLERERRRGARDVLTRLRRLSEEVTALPVLDARAPDAIVGYDEHGLPQVTGVVIDTSSAMAILTGEPSQDDLSGYLADASERLISAGTLIELGIVLEARIGPAAPGIIDRFLRDATVEVVAVDRAQVDRALEGWRRFGRGRHPAGLNLGDTFAYALAVSRGLPVLCTGEDFAATDVAVLRPVDPV